MDLTELKQACDDYQNAPPGATTFDWKSMLSLLPALLAIFIPGGGPLVTVITQVVQLLLNLFAPTMGAHFASARADHSAGTGPSAALVASMTAPGSQP